MNKRTIIVIAAIVLPIVAIGIMARNSGPPKPGAARPGAVSTAPGNLPATTQNAIRNAPTLEVMRTTVKNNLTRLEKMTQADWQKERAMRMRNNPRANPPATIEEVRARVKSRLTQLEAMTQEQWDAQLKRGRAGNVPPAATPAVAPTAPATTPAAPAAPAGTVKKP